MECSARFSGKVRRANRSYLVMTTSAIQKAPSRCPVSIPFEGHHPTTGSWTACLVHSYDPVECKYEIEWKDAKKAAREKLIPLDVFIVGDDTVTGNFLQSKPCSSSVSWIKFMS